MTASESFAHLHTASAYSLRYGASQPDALVAHAADLGQKILALTDRGGLYGAVKFAIASMAAGIAPVLGVDLAVASSGLLPAMTKPGPARRTPAKGGIWVEQRRPRVVLLARNRQGWASLCRLVSAAHLIGERGEPLADPNQIARYSDGLTLLLGAESECGRALASHRADVADRLLVQWREVFGDRLHIEVACHLTPHSGATLNGRISPGVADLSLSGASRLYRWAVDRGVSTVLTNAVRHERREQAPVVDVLDAIRRLVPLNERHLDRGNAEGYLKSSMQMHRIAEQVVSAAGQSSQQVSALMNRTVSLAQECALDPVADMGIGSVRVPELDVLMPNLLEGVEHQKAAADLLRRRCEEQIPLRYSGARLRQEATTRLGQELDTILKLGFQGYFLTVTEVVDLIRKMGVRVAARGSGAGSIVNHLLGISGVDPLSQGLLMERFLSPLRRSLPDIDIDVESARRTEVYEQILQRFGGDRCTCVSMMDTYRVRHAIRDVGGALGFPQGDIDSFAKAFPHIAARDIRAAMTDLPELRNSQLGRIAVDGGLDQFLDLVTAMDGLPRHVALHPCGVLLSDASLLDRTPVEASWQGFPMSQFDKDDVEEMGFLKLDVLGIRMQSAMAHAVAEIGRATGDLVDIDSVPLDDQATFQLIQSARTLGCFQIESPGQRELVGKFAPETFEDIVIDISLFRPGPVKSDMISPFLRARQGWALPDYLHENLRPILKQTAGVVVFHEQVIELISEMTGCTLAQADEVRRTLGSPEGQQQVRGWFYPAAISRSYPLRIVEEVWDVLRAFASFGFCKAHAAAFALPTYQSAWLKTHHPAAFYAGVLTHDPGMYPKRLILDDARNFGVPILGLDINRSDRVYRLERLDDSWGVRLPFAEVKGISAAEESAVVAGQPYSSLAEVWHRSGLSRPIAERLVLAGAFDDLHSLGSNSPGRFTRKDLLLQIIELEQHSRSLQRSRGARRSARKRAEVVSASDDPSVAARRQSQAPAQVSDPEQVEVQLSLDLFAPSQPVASGLPEMGPSEQVRAEVEVLGMDVSSHIVSFYDQMLDALSVVRSHNLRSCRSEAEVLVAGVKVATQTPPVRGGHRVIFLTLDDSTGPVDATFFENTQADYAMTLFHSWLLLVRGRIRRTGRRGISLRATGCWELAEIWQLWRQSGVAGVHQVLADSPEPRRGNSQPHTSRKTDQPTAGGMGQRRRVLVHASGFRMSPYADIKPAGDEAGKPQPRPASDRDGPPGKLWHSSPGSSGW